MLFRTDYEIFTGSLPSCEARSFIHLERGLDTSGKGDIR